MRFDRRKLALMGILILSSVAGAQRSHRQILVYKKKFIMGTVFEIAAYGRSSNQTALAIDRAFQKIIDMDDLMSNYKPESPLSRLNRTAHFHSEKVPPDLYRVIQETINFSRMSDGKFDITVAPLVNLWKAALSGDSIPSESAQQQAQACVGYDKIELTPPHQITFHSSCLELDLGAIGKGYAVDRAAEVLRSFGIRNAFINAGGSTILAIGSPPGQTGWLVHLRDPSRKIDPTVTLTNQSLSTSEQSQPSILGHDSPGHIIDPSTGKPLETDFAVNVVAPTGTISDGLSTTLLLLGPTAGKHFVNRTKGISAAWISSTTQVETAINGPQILFSPDH
ncbi:MAG TPA: FAD:protein FMN transferase [Candidatus Sulfotelmatobacter sp.]|jgi:thiamine biosynthesis lipoprotein